MKSTKSGERGFQMNQGFNKMIKVVEILKIVS